MHKSNKSVIQNYILQKPYMFTVISNFLRDGAWCQSRNSSASIRVDAFSDDAVFCPLWLWKHTIPKSAQRVLVPIRRSCILPQRLCCSRRRPGWMWGCCQRSRSTELWQQGLAGNRLLWHWALFLRCGHMWGGFPWKPQTQTCRDLQWDQYVFGFAGCCFGCKCNCERLPGLYPKEQIFWLLQG